MRRIVAFSGGLSSFEVARRLVIEHGPSEVECVFCDTKTEDEDLYRFVNETIAYLKCQYVHLADGRDIWEVFTDTRFMGNSRVDPCSRVLKRELFTRYLDEADRATTILYYGISANEAHRYVRLVERWSPLGFKLEAPLIALQTTKEQILVELEKTGIAPPRLYELGFEHNNCGGFCVKTGQRQMEHLLKVLPERYAYHEAKQEDLFKIIEPHGFIRRTTDGEMAYLSLKQFRELVEAKQPIQRFEDGACACFS